MRNIVALLFFFIAINSYGQSKLAKEKKVFENATKRFRKYEEKYNIALKIHDSIATYFSFDNSKIARANSKYKFEKNRLLSAKKNFEHAKKDFEVAILRDRKLQKSDSTFSALYKHNPFITRGFYLTFNPVTLLEPVQAGLGAGIGYRFNKRFDVWVGADILFKSISPYDVDKRYNEVHGSRIMVNGKYFYARRKIFFVGAEFRLKQYSFSDKNNFANAQTADTINNFMYYPKHTLFGAAIFWGMRRRLSKNARFEYEGLAGIGVKHRFINRQYVPDGYKKYEPENLNTGCFKLINYDFLDNEQDLPYLMGSFSILYHL